MSNTMVSKQRREGLSHLLEHEAREKNIVVMLPASAGEASVRAAWTSDVFGPMIGGFSTIGAFPNRLPYEGEFTSASTIDRDRPSQEMVAKVLPYLLPEVLNGIAELNSKIASLEATLLDLRKNADKPSRHIPNPKFSKQREIYLENLDVLKQKFSGKWVAMSLKGEVIESADSELELLDALEEGGVDKEGVFIAHSPVASD